MFDWLTGSNVTPELVDANLVLRAARPGDFEEWHAARKKSHAFLKPFEPRWSEADLKKSVFNQKLRRAKSAAFSGSEYAFLIFDTSGGNTHLVGGVTLSNIRRRSAQMGSLGYWMSVDHAGKGIMARAVGIILPFSFNTLRLHRVQAACLPINLPSRKVLEKNGFVEEGYAENYLQINGQWQDHALYALSIERYEGRRK